MLFPSNVILGYINIIMTKDNTFVYIFGLKLPESNTVQACQFA